MKLKSNYIYFLVLFIFAMIQYGNTLDHQYAWDDTIVMTGNERVQKGFDGISEVFRNIKADEAQFRYGYRPISLASFALEVGMFGMDPKVSHTLNCILFGVLAVMLFILLRRIFTEKHLLFPLLIALLFITHPIHSEVVANVKSRDEMLTMFFGISSLLFILNYLEKDRWKYLQLGGALLCLLLSFLSKENGIVFTALMALVIYYKKSDGTGWKDRLIYLVPLAGVLLLLAVRWYVYSDWVNEDNSIALNQQGIFDNDKHASNPLELVGFGSVLANSFYIALKNIMLLVMPYPLLHDYSHMPVVGWGDPMVLASVLLHLFLLFVVIKNFRKKTPLVFGILFYFISLSIYLHVLRVGPDYMAERFLFIPSIGFFIVMVCLGELVFQHSLSVSAKLSDRKVQFIVFTFAAITLVGFVMTRKRNAVWYSNETLLEADIEHLENSVRANYNYANLLHGKYYSTSDYQKPALQKRILKHYEQSVNSSDVSLVSLMDLGNAYMEFGEPEKAKATFEQGRKTFKGNVIPGIQLAKYHVSKEEFDLAEGVLNETMEISDKNFLVYYLLGISQFKQGRVEEAIATLKAGEKNAVSIDDAAYFELLANLLNTLESPEAKGYYQKASSLKSSQVRH